MLTSWVVAIKDDADKTYYNKIWNDDDSTDGAYGSALEATMGDIYFCGDDEDNGHMKKNKWLKVYNNVQFGEDDDDNDKYWFWIEKSGKVYVPSNPDATATRYKLEDDEGESFGTRFTGSYYDNDSSDSLTVTDYYRRER